MTKFTTIDIANQVISTSLRIYANRIYIVSSIKKFVKRGSCFNQTFVFQIITSLFQSVIICVGNNTICGGESSLAIG